MEQSPIMDRLDNRLKYFPLAVSAAQILGLSCVILVGVWMGQVKGGFAWDGSEYQFNLHPLLMVFGLVFLNADTILVYRVFRNERKIYVKLIHAGLHLVSIIFTIIGLAAVFGFHNAQKMTNLYSIHSWIGLTTVILFFCQYVFGFVAFLFPGWAHDYRRLYLSVHVHSGMFIFACACMAALTGATEKVFFSKKAGMKYDEFAGEGVLVNIFALCILGLFCVVFWLVTNPRFKRPQVEDDERIPLQ